MPGRGKTTRKQNTAAADPEALVGRLEAIADETTALRARLAELDGERADITAMLTRTLGGLFGRRERIASELREVDAEIASRLARLRRTTAAAYNRTHPQKSRGAPHAPEGPGQQSAEPPAVRTLDLPTTPVVPVEDSIQPDGIVCLIDGQKRKMLMRHLKARYNITPEEYRAHFGLPDDYPMTAPGYSASQSKAVRKAVVTGKLAPFGHRKTHYSREAEAAVAEDKQ